MSVGRRHLNKSCSRGRCEPSRILEEESPRQHPGPKVGMCVELRRSGLGQYRWCLRVTRDGI